MTTESDSLQVLLEVKQKAEMTVSDELIEACFRLQSSHQYDKNRDTTKKMQALVEEALLKEEGKVLI